MFTAPVFPTEIEHAVTGRDIEDFRERFGLSWVDIIAITGIPRTRLNHYAKNPDQVVDDVTVALMIRFYSRFPDLVPAPRRFSMPLWYESIGGQSRIRLRLLSILFGRDANTGYRWMEKGAPLTTQMYNIVNLVNRKTDGLQALHDLACKEARYRGVAPFFSGSWTQPADGRPSDIAFADLAEQPGRRRRRAPSRVVPPPKKTLRKNKAKGQGGE